MIAAGLPSGVATPTWSRLSSDEDAPGRRIRRGCTGSGIQMVVGRVVGWLLIVLAVAAAGHEGITSLDAGAYDRLAFGELWAKIDIASLNLVQAVIQRYVWPWLWDGVILNLLLLPAWAVLSVPGIIMVLAFRVRDAGRRVR